jgi:hypothetical protein
VVQQGSPTTFPNIESTLRVHLLDAAGALNATSFDAGWQWVVHSRVANNDHQVTHGFIDDEPDTQRRRGRKPIVRNNFVTTFA